MNNIKITFAEIIKIREFTARNSIGLDITIKDSVANRTSYYQVTLYDDAAKRGKETLREGDLINVFGTLVMDMIPPYGEHAGLLKDLEIKIPRPVINQPTNLYNYSRCIDVLQYELNNHAESANAVSASDYSDCDDGESWF